MNCEFKVKSIKAIWVNVFWMYPKGRLQALINICIVETRDSTVYLSIPHKMNLQYKQFIDLLQIKTYANPRKLFFHLPCMIYIEQPYNTLHFDLLNNISIWHEWYILNNHMIRYVLIYWIIYPLGMNDTYWTTIWYTACWFIQ